MRIQYAPNESLANFPNRDFPYDLVTIITGDDHVFDAPRSTYYTQPDGKTNLLVSAKDTAEVHQHLNTLVRA